MALAFVVVVVALLAGCGSSGSPGRARYVSRAETICRAASAQTAPLINGITTAAASAASGSRAAASRLADDLRRLDEVAAAHLAQLQRLEQPSGDRTAIRRFLTPLATVVEAIGKAADTVGRGQLPEAIALLQRTAPTAQEATAAAKAYGLRQCAKVLPALG